MNNRSVGLYSFASTATWLHETGMASPPLLVTLGLTLPDSRILSGIASIGMTLANIAAILPHLRQPILDGMHTPEGALAHKEGTQEEINLSPEKSNATQPANLQMESSILASVSPCEKECESPPSTTVESVCAADTESLGCTNVKSEVVLQIALLPVVGKTDDEQILLQAQPFLDADPGEEHVSLFARKDRGALYIPLPVPDAEEIAFFDTGDTVSSDSSLEEYSVVACGLRGVAEDHSTTEGYGPAGEKVCIHDIFSDGEQGVEQDGQLVTAELSSPQGGTEPGGESINVAMLAADENITSSPVNGAVWDQNSPLVKSIVSDLSHGLPATFQGAQAKHVLASGKEALAIHRPECLEFIPQSVIRRYPSAPMVSAGRCLRHQTLNSRRDHQVSPPLVLVHNPTMLLNPRTSCTTFEGNCGVSFLTATRQSMNFGIGNSSVQDPVEQMPQSPLVVPIVHELTPLQKHPTHRHRLGVLARAALRDRRSTTYRGMDHGDDGSSTSDSDSDSDSDSRSSSGSSAYEYMLPHMLGADLIAAIDANSESGLNLAGSKRTRRTPLNLYEDFLISEDSAADVSMAMHVSSHEDASDQEVGANATFRSITYEDIEQWATGVVQKCVRQVCRNHAGTGPSSPSQASDVCAERPSGSGASQCPFSGLHCKLGTAALTEASAPRARGSPVSLLPPKPLQVRNLRDIPEFIPRQRPISTIMRYPRGLGMRSTIDATRDAATRVIARVENQARLYSRQ